MRQRTPARWGSSRRIGHSPYLLVEDDDLALAVSDFSLFQDAGFAVAHCSGPGAKPNVCPLVSGRPCPMVDGADVVLHGLDPALGLDAAIRQHHPEVPLVTVARRRHTTAFSAREALRGDTDLGAGSSIGAQLHAISQAL